MHQLVYYSRNNISATDGTRLSEVREILKASERNNRRDDVTGSLIFDKDWFLQILEGELDTVQATYNRIQSDARHSQVTVMATRPISRRQFPDWGMGGLMRSFDVQEIFLAHGIGGAIDPTKLTAGTVVDLALELKLFSERKRADVQAAN